MAGSGMRTQTIIAVSGGRRGGSQRYYEAPALAFVIIGKACWFGSTLMMGDIALDPLGTGANINLVNLNEYRNGSRDSLSRDRLDVMMKAPVIIILLIPLPLMSVVVISPVIFSLALMLMANHL